MTRPRLYQCGSALLLLFLYTSFATASVVTWLPNKSINLASNFKDNKLPCSKQSLVFPESVQETIQIDANIIVKQVYLPINGEILLGEGGLILSDVGVENNDENCTSNGDVYYKDDSNWSWSTPDVWSSPKFNKATPDSQRIPCYDDNVVFPEKSQFTVSLPKKIQSIRSLTALGRNWTTVTFLRHVQSQSEETQQFVFSNSPIPVIIRNYKCRSTAGCQCQNNAIEIECKMKYCPEVKCANPIKPEGNCCEICGGSIIFDVENFNMNGFKLLVKTIVDGYGKDKFDYHISKFTVSTLKTEKRSRLQLVVVERGEYTAASSEVVNEISYQMPNEWMINKKITLLSGVPSTEAGMGGKITGLVLLIVLLVMSTMFGYFYRNSKINMTELRSGVRMGVSGGMWSRFQRRSDSVVSLTRRDSNISGAGSLHGTAFRNPLYDSKRGRVQVTESVLEE